MTRPPPFATTYTLRPSSAAPCASLVLLVLCACGDIALDAPEPRDDHATADAALTVDKSAIAANQSDNALKIVRSMLLERAESGEHPYVHIEHVPRSQIESWIVPEPVQVIEDGVCTYDPREEELSEEIYEPASYVPRVASSARPDNRPVGRAALTEAELVETRLPEFEPPPPARQALIDDYRFRCRHVTRQPDSDCPAHPYVAERARMQAETDQAIMQERMSRGPHREIGRPPGSNPWSSVPPRGRP